MRRGLSVIGVGALLDKTGQGKHTGSGGGRQCISGQRNIWSGFTNTGVQGDILQLAWLVHLQSYNGYGWYKVY
jgi:hypothetical protein